MSYIPTAGPLLPGMGEIFPNSDRRIANALVREIYKLAPLEAEDLIWELEGLPVWEAIDELYILANRLAPAGWELEEGDFGPPAWTYTDDASFLKEELRNGRNS